MNSNPSAARRARKEKRRAAGDAAELQGVLWRAIERVAELLDDGDALADDIRRSAHTLAQLSPAYLKAIEVGEIEVRLAAIESAIEGKGTGGARKPA